MLRDNILDAMDLGQLFAEVERIRQMNERVFAYQQAVSAAITKKRKAIDEAEGR
jgi:hypothetical protein